MAPSPCPDPARVLRHGGRPPRRFVLLPVFFAACARAEPRFRRRLLFHSAPAFLIWVLQAMLANHSIPCSLIPIGPMAVAGASAGSSLVAGMRRPLGQPA